MEQLLGFINTIVSVLGFIVLIVTVLLTLRELKNVREQTLYQAQSVEVATVATMYAGWLEMDKVFIEHSELFPFFYQQQELDPNDPLMSKFIPIASYVLDILELTALQLESLPKDWHSKQLYDENCSRMFFLSPMMCKYYDGVSDAFSQKLRQWRKEGEAMRKAQNTNPID